MAPLVLKSFDDLKDFVGREINIDWFEITQDRILRFAEATEDRQWIHLDPARAKRESPYGATIAHGFLTVSLLPKLAREAVDVRAACKMRVNYGFNKLRFVSPVRADSRVRARFTPQKVTENEVTWLVTVDVEGSEKPAIVAEWLGRFY